METLETLSNFVEKYPQKKDEKLQYSFLGGTAVRLIQESINWKYKRPISDFDILVFERNFYPVHQCTVNDVFGIILSNYNEIIKCLTSTFVKGKEYFFMNGTFLTLTKTCAIDTPREKDFRDIEFLYNSKFIDMKQLKHLFGNATRLTRNSDLALDTFNWLLKDTNANKVRLFQTFPRFTNLLDEFDNPGKIRGVLLEYVQRDQYKSGYELASIIYDSHSFLRELKNERKEKKEEVLEELLRIAEKNDYTDFDRIIHRDFIPKIRYSSSKEKEELLKTLFKKPSKL